MPQVVPYRQATQYEDIHEHWDYETFCPRQGKLSLIDAKDAKSLHRGGVPQDNLIVCEFQNVRGETGSLLGKADCFHQSLTDGSELCIDRELLLQHILDIIGIPTEANLQASPKKTDPVPYQWYHRRAYGRDDNFAWVPVSDLLQRGIAVELSKLQIPQGP